MTDTAERIDSSKHWPWLLSMRPHRVVLVAVAVLAVVWGLVVAVDVLGIGRPAEEGQNPLWPGLFNNGIVEYVQWVFNALAIVAAGYLAGRLAGGRYAGAASFFLVLAIGLSLILIEEASDIRLAVAAFLKSIFSEDRTLLGVHYHVVGSLPILLILAFFPLYALVRYGKHIWPGPTARKYLVATYSLYGVSQIASLSAHFGGFYVHLGGWIDTWVFGGQLPPIPHMALPVSNFFIVDSAVEETLEILAVACMLALMVAFTADLRAGRLAGRQEQPDLKAEHVVLAAQADTTDNVAVDAGRKDAGLVDVGAGEGKAPVPAP